MKKKILVVDDSVTIRDQVSYVLTSAGFSVVVAENGNRGLEKLAAEKDFDLIICDVHMPEMNGVEMIEAINKDSSSKKVPVVFLTTENTDEVIDRARAAGAKAWIVKPFKPEHLLTAVKKLT